jgi:plasmid stability protein
MKNITVSIEDETYRLARVRAAEAGTSVSALVRAYLVALVQGQVPKAEFDRLRWLQDETLEAIRPRGGSLRAADNLPRDALHERHALP